MKYIALVFFFMVMLVSNLSSAVVVEARSLWFCTVLQGGECYSGTQYIKPLTLGKKSGATCEWGANCEVWVPKGVTSFSDARGVYLTCCMATQGTENNPGYQFYYYDKDTLDWETVDHQGYWGTDSTRCSTSPYYVFGGTEVDAFDYWDYDSADYVARCVGWATNYDTGGPVVVYKAIEYWMDY